MQEVSSEGNKSNDIETEYNFCIWLIETGYFTFTNRNIVNWNSLTTETVKKIFSNPIYSGLIK
jgi:ABC-type sulfate transport system substrate-binding protein